MGRGNCRALDFLIKITLLTVIIVKRLDHVFHIYKSDVHANELHFFSTMPAHYTVVKDKNRESSLWPVSRVEPRISWWPPTSLVVV